MDIGIESIAQSTYVDENTDPLEATMELMEAVIVMENTATELDGLLTLEANLEDIKACITEHGIDAGVETLVGKEVEAICGRFDKDDPEGTLAGFDAGFESITQKTKDIIARIIEAIKKFFAKLVVNKNLIENAYSQQLQRVTSLKTRSWKKEKNEYEFFNDGEVHDLIKKGKDAVSTVFGELEKQKWSVKSTDKDIDALADGSLVKNLRQQSKLEANKETIKCNDITAKKAFSNIEKQGAAAFTLLGDIAKMKTDIERINPKYIEDKTPGKDKGIPVTKALRGSSNFLAASSIVILKDMRTMTSVLKNIK